METMDLETDVCRSRDLSLHLVPYKLKVQRIVMSAMMIVMTTIPSLIRRLCTCVQNSQALPHNTPGLIFINGTFATGPESKNIVDANSSRKPKFDSIVHFLENRCFFFMIYSNKCDDNDNGKY